MDPSDFIEKWNVLKKIIKWKWWIKIMNNEDEKASCSIWQWCFEFDMYVVLWKHHAHSIQNQVPIRMLVEF